MDIYAESIRDLTPAEKLLLVERIWDDLASANAPLPLPAWAVKEAKRRLTELLDDSDLGMTDEEVWTRIQESRNA